MTTQLFPSMDDITARTAILKARMDERDVWKEACLACSTPSELAKLAMEGIVVCYRNGEQPMVSIKWNKILLEPWFLEHAPGNHGFLTQLYDQPRALCSAVYGAIMDLVDRHQVDSVTVKMNEYGFPLFSVEVHLKQ